MSNERFKSAGGFVYNESSERMEAISAPRLPSRTMSDINASIAHDALSHAGMVVPKNERFDEITKPHTEARMKSIGLTSGGPMQHTPGPWHEGGKDGCTIVYDKSGYAIANCITYHGRHGADQMVANARLIASAPELLAACIMARSCMRPDDNDATAQALDTAIRTAARQLSDRTNGKIAFREAKKLLTQASIVMLRNNITRLRKTVKELRP